MGGYNEPMSTLGGKLLIAPAHMTDPNFSRTVVLVIQHDEGGAIGVVLNRPTPQSLAAIWAHVAEGACSRDLPLHAGGPVAGPLVALHGDSHEADVAISKGVFCTLATERVVRLVKSNVQSLRLFAGYAGWGQGQLEGELQSGSWLTINADRELVFETDDAELWRMAFRRASSPDVYPDHFGEGDISSPNLN